MTNRSGGRRARLALLVTTALLASGATAGTASAATTTFSNSTAITIPDSGPGSVYPSDISVSGFAGNVQNVTATLRGFNHSCPDDLAVLLVGPSGKKSILMANVGGCPGSDLGPIDITFDQTSESSLNNTDDVTAGTFAPSQEDPPDPLSFPAPAPPYGVNLGAFTVAPANGTWQLFVDDQASGDDGTVAQGWSLKITAPVNTATAGKPKLNKKKGTARIPVTVGDAGQLTLSGKGVKTASASKSVAVGGPGTINLTVKPKGKTRKRLNSSGTATVKVTITFTPNGGSPSVQTKKIKLKKTL